ncbi:hypothetical protein VKS41_000901 [Umbelopsis sp. WA50703]
MRAAAGGDTSKVADEDLDKYVAELIHKEAMAKNKKYDQVGLKAYQPEPNPPANLPRMNKRFLLNVVKATDSHNQALIKATEDQAEANRRRMERERRSNDYREEPSPGRSKRRRLSRSPSPSSSNMIKHRKHYSLSLHSKSTECRSSTPEKHSDLSDSDTSQRSLEKPTSTGYRGRGNITAGGPSTMDKYFKDSYDPMLDTGEAVDDKGWVIGSASTEKKSNKKKKKKSKSQDDSGRSKRHKSKKHKKHKSDRNVTIDTSASTNSLNNGIVYNKGVREWDMGKK